MKRFKFSLQALLTLRQRAEQTALEKYASALLSRQRALELVDAVRREQNESWARWRQEVSQGCSAGALVQARACDRQVSERRQRAEVTLGQAEIAANQALQQMLLARRDREAVEKHLHKQRLLYTRECAREEQKVLDDLAHRRVQPAFETSAFHLASS